MTPPRAVLRAPAFWMTIALLSTNVVYWPGLSGGWLFDDYPSIVNNHAVQPPDLSGSSLLDAALSSTASDFKRPLASLSFALNYHAAGLDPFWMKLTNLLIHLLNGVLVFLLARALLCCAGVAQFTQARLHPEAAESTRRSGIVAVLIAAGWMLLPINLTGVLYVVQRMESMANVFVLLGLLGYVMGRQRMLTQPLPSQASKPVDRGLILCVLSLTLPTVLGLMAKETAVMLPLYALLIEWALFRARRPASSAAPRSDVGAGPERNDRRIWALFGVILVLPMIIGLVWMVPRVLDPNAWSARDFTLRTRLLSEARIVLDYLHWTLLPSTRALKFYYDDFVVSSGWLTPWSTLTSVLVLVAMLALIFWLCRRVPLAALGLALFLAAQLLTGTILPLELVFEHRNYFASFGLLLALVPLLAAPGPDLFVDAGEATDAAAALRAVDARSIKPLPYARARYALLGILMFTWTVQTALGAYIWGSPLRLTRALAERSPDSPRAQYDLGRSYSVYSQYDPSSPFIPQAYAALEKAASLPRSSILPDQALIYMNARMHVPAKDVWWNRMIAKLKANPPTVQDAGSLRTLSICSIEKKCDLSKNRLSDAFQAALSHPSPGAQLQARYGDYAWSVLGDQLLGERMLAAAVQTDPSVWDYRVAHVRMLVALGRTEDARVALRSLESLNTRGHLDGPLRELRALPGLAHD